MKFLVLILSLLVSTYSFSHTLKIKGTNSLQLDSGDFTLTWVLPTNEGPIVLNNIQDHDIKLTTEIQDEFINNGHIYKSDTVSVDCGGVISEIKPGMSSECNLSPKQNMKIFITDANYHSGSSGLTQWHTDW